MHVLIHTGTGTDTYVLVMAVRSGAPGPRVVLVTAWVPHPQVSAARAEKRWLILHHQRQRDPLVRCALPQLAAHSVDSGCAWLLWTLGEPRAIVPLCRSVCTEVPWEENYRKEKVY